MLGSSVHGAGGGGEGGCDGGADGGDEGGAGKHMPEYVVVCALENRCDESVLKLHLPFVRYSQQPVSPCDSALAAHAVWQSSSDAPEPLAYSSVRPFPLKPCVFSQSSFEQQTILWSSRSSHVAGGAASPHATTRYTS